MHSLLSSDHPHSCREFSVPRALFLCLLFFSCMNVASSSSSAELLSQLLAHLRILLVSPYFLSPVLLFSFSCFMSRSRVKPSATTGSADEKGISTLSFSRPSASLLSSHLPSYSNFFALFPLFLSLSPRRTIVCVVLRRRGTPLRRPSASRAESSFLNLSWYNRLGVII